MTNADVPFGPSGLDIYNRTYSRKLPDGTSETWPQTVARVAEGNMTLAYGHPDTWAQAVHDEAEELYDHIFNFRILPAGRHLWATGIRGKQYLFNCWTSGWGEKFSGHAEFTFMRLMEGGGVGANYSGHYLEQYGSPRRELQVHIVCDPDHADWMELAPHLSAEYASDWEGAFEVEDSREGWAAALVDLIDTFFTTDTVVHEKRVYDVSRVRPKGARLKTFGGTASGPEPFAKMLHEVANILNGAVGREGDDVQIQSLSGEWLREFETLPAQLTSIEAMEIDHAIAQCVVSGGVRRSARMSMVRWDDPHVIDFIACKSDQTSHSTTNISVEVDDEFIGHLTSSATDDRAVLARTVHSLAVKAMLSNGEPGYWNKSLSNHGELTEIYCTNPCGEITLEAWEACNLGHVNLSAFAPFETIEQALALQRAHELVTRFLIRATFADIVDDKSVLVQGRNRRIGVGHTGVQGFLVKNGMRYSDAPGSSFETLLRGQYERVRETGRQYAFELRIPEPIKVTTVAPTGTVSKLAGVTEGIHPIYARHFIRRIRFSSSDPDQAARLALYEAEGYDVEPCIYAANTSVVSIPTKELLVEQVEALGYDSNIVESADELSLDEMLSFQAMYQAHWADNAVSFTANFPEGSIDQADAEATLARFLPVLKGTTVMPDGTREQAPYERLSEAEYEAAAVKTVEDSVDEDCSSGACPVR